MCVCVRVCLCVCVCVCVCMCVKIKKKIQRQRPKGEKREREGIGERGKEIERVVIAENFFIFQFYESFYYDKCFAFTGGKLLHFVYIFFPNRNYFECSRQFRTLQNRIKFSFFV